MKTLLSFLIAGAFAFAQNGTIKSNIDASRSPTSKPFGESAADPATCTAGQIYRNTATGELRFCQTANVWVDLATNDGSLPISVVTYGASTGATAAANTTAIQAAIVASGQSGRVSFPKGVFDFAGLTITNDVILEGAGTTTLNYTGLGTAITWNSGTNILWKGMRDITLVGHGASTIGLLLGGTNGAAGFTCTRCFIGGFNVTVKYAANTWLTLFDQSTLSAGLTAVVLFPDGLSSAGEQIQFRNTLFLGNNPGVGVQRKCIDIEGATTPISFVGGAFDNGCLFFGGAGLTRAVFEHVHFETGGPPLTSPFIEVLAGNVGWSPSVEIHNCDTIMLAGSQPTVPALFSADSSTLINVDGFSYWNFTAAPAAVLQLLGNASGSVDHLHIQSPVPIPGIVNSGTGSLQSAEIARVAKLTPSGDGWYRVYATPNVNPGGVLRIVRDFTSADNTSVEIEVQFWVGGYTTGAVLTQTRYGSYGSNVVDQIRASADASGNRFLDLHIVGASSAPITLRFYGQNTDSPVNNPIIGAVAGATASTVLATGGGVRTTGPIVGSSLMVGPTVLNQILTKRSSLTFPSIPAASCQQQAVTVPGASVTNYGLFCSPADWLGNTNLTWAAYVNSADTVFVRACNPTAGAITPTTGFWGCTLFQ